MKLLLVDDDLQSIESTRKILEMESYQVDCAYDGLQALAKVRASVALPSEADHYRLIISDVRMPQMGGLDFLSTLKTEKIEIPVVLITAYGSVEQAVGAMRLGAVDFLTKPFKLGQLIEIVKAAVKRKQRFLKNATHSWIGRSAAFHEICSQINKVAQSKINILITGESGTGKELVARMIHDKSQRAHQPFVAINCAAVPDNLIESELFGVERGAYTGAHSARSGLFEAAQNGTLLLDEIGDMPLTAQAKLLRVLQEGEIRRIGSTLSRRIDVRVLAATHQELRKKVKEGLFREDLLYRLEGITVTIPPLRQRTEDIDELAQFFLEKYADAHHKECRLIEPLALKRLLTHTWPGNVRELSNVIERAVIFSSGPAITLENLPEHLQSGLALSTALSSSRGDGTITVPVGTPLREVENLMIQKTLQATDGDRTQAARLLGLHARTIERHLDRLKNQ